MEAEKLQKKKINKGKLKKTIKNVICRPDPVLWPTTVPEWQENILEKLLSVHRVHIPLFKKPHWKELKSIPKDQRPKQPKIEKPNGLIFGITDCADSIANAECTTVLIEATVNPRTIVQPVLEACRNVQLPIIYFNGLRKASATYFGFPTSCLGLKKGFMLEISEKIRELAKNNMPKLESAESCEFKDVEMSEKRSEPDEMETQECLYLYRTSKKNRVFVPPLDDKASTAVKRFAGQDFIEFIDENNSQPKSKFMKMMVKRMTNNPNRINKSKKNLKNNDK